MAKKKHQLEQLKSQGKISIANAKLREIKDNLTPDQWLALKTPDTEITPDLQTIIDHVEALSSDLESAQNGLERANAAVKIADKANHDIKEKQRREQIISEVEEHLGVPVGYLSGASALAPQPSPPGQKEKPLPFSDLWPEYRAYKIRAGKWSNETKPNQRKLKEYDSQFRDFLEIMGDDLPVSEFNRKSTATLIDGLLAWPLNRKKNFPGTPLADIPNNVEKISPSTASQRLDTLKGFFKFLEKEDYIAKNWLQGEQIERNSKNYSTPTTTDLKEWFNLPEELISHAWQFWIPRIALYSGARQNEIAQLKPKDIAQDEDTLIWYFSVQDSDAGNSTKSKASRRRVPLHSQLIENGFIDYWKIIKSKYTESLWPSLKEKSGKRGTNVSTYWGCLKSKHQVLSNPLDEQGRAKVFHGLRRVILNQLSNADVDLITIQSIVGHEPSLGASKSYIDEPAPLSRKKAAIEKLKIVCVNWDHPQKFMTPPE